MREAMGEIAQALPYGFRYLEIGFGAGESLHNVLKGHPKDVTIIDPFNLTFGGTTASSGDCRSLVEQALSQREAQDGDGLWTRPAYRIHAMESRRGIERILANKEGPFDLVLIDGDHTAKGAAQDLQQVVPLVAQSGMLVFDDLQHPAHRYLSNVWTTWLQEYPTFESVRSTKGHGYGIAWRRNGE